MSIIDTVKQWVDPEKGMNSLFSRKLTPQMLSDRIVSQFEEEIPERSINKYMMFPMSFNVMMCEDDYDRLTTSFGPIIEPILDALYEVLEKKMGKKNSKYMVCRPAANSWFFQFAKCDIGMDNATKTPRQILPGQLIITADLCTFNLNSMTAGKNVKPSVSFRCVNSNLTDKMNLNRDILASINMIGDTTFAPSFDYSRISCVSVDKSFVKESSGIAELIVGATSYSISDDLVDISGAGDTRKLKNVIVIDGYGLQNQHVQIKHVGQGQFQIAAYHAPVLLNESQITVSTRGNVVWETLPNNSIIFINNRLQLKFKIN